MNRQDPWTVQRDHPQVHPGHQEAFRPACRNLRIRRLYLDGVVFFVGRVATYDGLCLFLIALA